MEQLERRSKLPRHKYHGSADQKRHDRRHARKLAKKQAKEQAAENKA